LLSYSNDKIKELKTNKDELNKGFMKLFADYLLTKQIISTNSNDIFSWLGVDNQIDEIKKFLSNVSYIDNILTLMKIF
jgi:uncharacterized coiled-coil DUF342 family protein